MCFTTRASRGRRRARRSSRSQRRSGSARARDLRGRRRRRPTSATTIDAERALDHAAAEARRGRARAPAALDRARDARARRRARPDSARVLGAVRRRCGRPAPAGVREERAGAVDRDGLLGVALAGRPLEARRHALLVQRRSRSPLRRRAQRPRGGLADERARRPRPSRAARRPTPCAVGRGDVAACAASTGWSDLVVAARGARAPRHWPRRARSAPIAEVDLREEQARLQRVGVEARRAHAGGRCAACASRARRSSKNAWSACSPRRRCGVSRSGCAVA